ncbi:MAG: tol-pal system protein YbgF [Magnetococcales bacterium]|nr:tol-pal system protein YbgF [Magnetococcales bacterium]
MRPWVPALLLFVLPFSGCVSGNSSGRDSGGAEYYEGSDGRRPPVRNQAGPPPELKAPLPERVDTLANRVEKDADIQRSVATDLERRLGLMEREVTTLRGSVDELHHAKARLEAELIEKEKQIQQSASTQAATQSAQPDGSDAPDANDPDYDPADQGSPEEPSKVPDVAAGKSAASSVAPASGTVAKAVPPASSEKKSSPPVAKSKPESPKKAYEEAFLLLKGGRYEESLVAFKNYMEWFPNDNLSDNAQYWIGELYYVQRKFPDALMAFNQVLVRWPTSGKIPASLLKIGFSFFELGDMENAKNSLSRLVSDYPDSPAISMAKQRLEMIEEKQKGH